MPLEKSVYKLKKNFPLFQRKIFSIVFCVFLCEGDGSERLPIRLPKDGELVFFPKTDTVIGVHRTIPGP
ncbi:MAG: hypothetical protein ACLTS6_16980 [Anaerobutyricum sp.]